MISISVLEQMTAVICERIAHMWLLSYGEDNTKLAAPVTRSEGSVAIPSA